MIDALRQGREPAFERDDERLIYRLGHRLYATRRVDETLYAEAVAAFGEPAVVELVGVFGYYALVAMTLNVFQVRRGSDAPLPFAEP
ncbi:hypothetical protein D3C76_1504160 [compost metagenome]